MPRIHPNPDSWEGWYWGAVHHWGYTLRVGQSETYGTVEDCLQNCDMIVFWAADPESTSGSYGAQEGTTQRRWLKDAKLGIKVVHVDPHIGDRHGHRDRCRRLRREALAGKELGTGIVIRSRKASTTKIMSRHTRWASTSGKPICSAKRTASRKRQSGRKTKPAFRPKTSAHWHGNGVRSASISRRAAGAMVTAALAVIKPE